MELEAREDAPRDRWGRYLIVAPDGKQRSYTRVTTIAKAPSEEGALKAWSNRMVATGLVRRPDLLAAASTKLDDKGALGKICDQAIEAAGAHSRANFGTALHALTEQLDLGNKPEILPGLKADIDAYHATLANCGVGIDTRYVEQVVIHDAREYEGTLDRVCTIDGVSYIADLKTGADLSYAWREIATQLALYADAEHCYDWRTGERTPMPTIDHNRAVVIHLPAGTGKCDLYWIDLEAGRAGYELAFAVRTWRKRQDMFERWKPATIIEATFPLAEPAVEPDALTVKRRDWLRDRIANMPDEARDKLKSLWPVTVAIKDANDDDIDKIAKACTVTETHFDLTFPKLDPKTRRPRSRK